MEKYTTRILFVKYSGSVVKTKFKHFMAIRNLRLKTLLLRDNSFKVLF